MNSARTETEYDHVAVDRAFILSLFHAFFTVVPDDVRSRLAKSEADALQFLMILRPRLTSFSHRRVNSLRHPAVSMAARRYYITQRAAIREEEYLRGELGSSTQNAYSTTSIANNSSLARTSVAASAASSAYHSVGPSRVMSLPVPSTLNIPTIGVGQLNQNKWKLLEPCYEVLLRHSKPRVLATQTIEVNEMVNDIISRYWERITVPPGEYAEVSQSLSLDTSDTVGEEKELFASSQRLGSTRRTYATHMTALQYVYLNLRISSVLLPPESLESELLDSIVSDLRIDATPRRKLNCVSFEKPPQLYGHRDSDDGRTDVCSSQSTIQHLREMVSLEFSRAALSSEASSTADGPTRANNSAAAPSEDASTSAATDIIPASTGPPPPGGERGGSPSREKKFATSTTTTTTTTTTTNGVKCSLSNLPDISFGQFWRSMLELADNWTSTTHPTEQAMFLMELYCEVFAHEWDDEDAALLKTLRATVAERASVRQDDLLSLYDESEKSSNMEFEFNQMTSSLEDFASPGMTLGPGYPKKSDGSIVDEYISGIRDMPVTPEGSLERSANSGSTPSVRRITAVGTGGTDGEQHRLLDSSLSSWLITESERSSIRSGVEEEEEEEEGGTGRRKRHGRERGKRDDDGKRRHRRAEYDSDTGLVRSEDSGDFSRSFDSLFTQVGKRRRRRSSERASGSMGVGAERGEDRRRGKDVRGGRRGRDERRRRRDDERERREGSSSGSSSGALSWGDISSPEYSVPDSELTPLSLSRRQKEREERRRRRYEKHRRQLPGDKKESEGATVAVSASEVAARRARLVETLRAKGITIPAEFLTDDVILKLTGDTVDPMLLRRLMQGAGLLNDELSESDFIRIMLGDDDQFLGTGAIAADKDSVLAALRKPVARHPPETAYARRRRELQEQLLREQERAAARAAGKREKKKSHRRDENGTESPSPLETPVTELESSPSPDITEPVYVSREGKRQEESEEKLDMESGSSDSLAGLWTSGRRGVISPPPMRPGLPRHHPFLPLPSVPRLFVPPITSEITYDEVPGVHLHSEEKLEMFYRNIRKDQPIKGRAPLSPQTSIRGGTYHQMSLARARLRRGQRWAEGEEEPQEGRCAPVKLFSLTTKTSFAEALRESLQRYVDDKTYLDNLYGGYSR